MWQSDPASLPFDLKGIQDDEAYIGTDPWLTSVCLGDAKTLPGIKPQHATLLRDGSGWSIVPEEGQVFVNREPLRGRRRLEDGDCILLPGIIIQYWAGRLENVPLPESVAKSDNLGSYMDELGQSVKVSDLSDERGGRAILSGISFAAKDGAFIGILGPSGCGKSSLIQRMAGLADWRTGEIRYDDVPFRENKERLRHLIAYVPQEADACLHANLSVWQEVDCHLRLRAARSATDLARKRAALVSMGLWDQRQKRVGELSGGQRRRLSISLALLRRPQLLLLDEPTSGLDPATEAALMQYLRKLSRQGCTVVCSTHMLANIDLFTHVLVLDGKGAMDRWCTPDEILGKGIALPEMYKRLAMEKRPPVPPKRPFGGLRESLCFSFKGCRHSRVRTVRDKLTVNVTSSPSWWRTVWGYILRNMLDLVGAAVRILREPIAGGRGASSGGRWHWMMCGLDKGVRAFWAARASLWLFVIQPVVMAIAIRFAVADKFTVGVKEYTIPSFCVALSAFWLGVSHAARLLVGERVPGRCLERLDGVSVTPYLFAQFLWCAMAAVIQVFFFLIPYFAWKTLPSPPIDSCWQPAGFFTHWFVLFFVHWMGGAVGLAVSAFNRRETTAISWIPLVGMVVLLLGAPVLGFDPHDKDREWPAAERLAQSVMPCTPAEEILDLTHREYEITIEDNRSHLGKLKKERADEKESPREWRPFFRRSIIYVLLCFFLAYNFQKGNESSWEGR